ncbi:hypothetical protein CREGCYN_07940 [Synechococcus sp. M16CYN]
MVAQLLPTGDMPITSIKMGYQLFQTINLQPITVTNDNSSVHGLFKYIVANYFNYGSKPSPIILMFSYKPKEIEVFVI